MTDDSAHFEADRSDQIRRNSEDAELQAVSFAFTLASLKARYSYNFDWLGRPIIQYPQDIVALQEVMWTVKPDFIIETGIARGGSLIMSASMLALLDYCDAADAGLLIDPRVPKRRVLGIDIDIRSHNRRALVSHPLSSRIDMLEGSSIDAMIVASAREMASRHECVLVCLDSNHTSDHVFAELQAYAPLVSKESYCVVFDTVIGNVPDELNRGRPWTRTDNPRSAVERYLRDLEKGDTLAADGDVLRLMPDSRIDGKLLISAAPGGYLRRVGSPPMTMRDIV
jgi:cephalosporin hydroxylase